MFMRYADMEKLYKDAPRAVLKVAARLGLEPRYTAPEAVVLPLDDLAIGKHRSAFHPPTIP